MTVRTVEDAEALSEALNHTTRLLVIGAGFLGGEIAAAARRRGVEVVLVEPQAAPQLTTVDRSSARSSQTCTQQPASTSGSPPA